MLELRKEIIGNRLSPKEIFIISDKENNQVFDILYQDNGDLYFNGINTETRQCDFTINRSDLVLYRVFNNLFSYLENASINYDSKHMMGMMYNKNKNIITVLSDDLIDYNTKLRNALIIKKNVDNFKVIFRNNSVWKKCSIRFNTNRSMYGNLVFLFTNLHTELGKLVDYYQLDFEDCDALQKIKSFKN